MARPGKMMGPKPKLENPGKILGRLLKYIGRHYTVHLILTVISIVVGVICQVRGTMFMQTLIDVYITPMITQVANGEAADFSGLLAAIMEVVNFYAVAVIASFAQNYLMIFVTQGTLKNFRDDLFTRMEKLPISYFDTHTHGDIMSIYTNDTDTLRQMISQALPQFISSAITIVSVVVMMFVLNVPLTILALVMVGLMLIVTKKAAGASSKYFVAQQADLGALNGYIEEMVEGQKVVKVFCHEEKAKEGFKEKNDKLFDSAYNANKYVNYLGPINAQMGNVGYVVCAAVGGVIACSVTAGGALSQIPIFSAFTLGSLASFLTYYKSFNMPISQVFQQFNSVIMALAGADRIFKLLDEQPEADEGYVTLVNVKKENGGLVESEKRTGLWAWKHVHQADGTVTYVELKGDVVFDDVDFGYVPDKMVLHNVSMFATPGQKIAFVGSTGAGKTTITNLINRFYDIQDGKIRYDGININKIKKADLRHSLGMVLQDTNLFSDTVMENIRYGKLDATDEEVIAAAKLANAHEFITHLENGYNTKLTNNGASLSQGQRQLLAIARAAVADPPVLILDEATSSIDTRTERIVQEGMDKLMKGRTTFVIAHRLSTVKNSDCIMVLEQGRVIERGNHDELMAAGGRYYQLYTGNKVSEA